MKQKALDYIRENPEKFSQLLKLVNNAPGNNVVELGLRKGNRLKLGSALLRGTQVRTKGSNNIIEIADLSVLFNCRILIHGNNNRIVIDRHVVMNHAELWIEDDHNLISIGEDTSVAGSTHLAAIEGTSIIVGRDCMFSSDIRFATGDSHSLIDLNGRRINSSRSITIGDHVWVGTRVIGLKGFSVASNSTIGTGSLLNGRYDEENVVLAGNPAKVVKRDVRWLRERI